MSEASAHLVDHVLPEVPIRQWVLTFPCPIRFLLTYRPELLRAVRRIFVRTLFSFLRRRSRERARRPKLPFRMVRDPSRDVELLPAAFLLREERVREAEVPPSGTVLRSRAEGKADDGLAPASKC